MIPEIIDSPIYDTLYTLAPRHRKTNSERETMFIHPVGQMVTTKTGLRTKYWSDTNMVVSGMLDFRHTFLVKHIRCALIGRRIFPCDSRYYRDTFLELQINRKTYWEGPLWKCADPATMLAAADTLLKLPSLERKEIIASLRKQLDRPVPIQPQETFCAQVTLGDSWFEAWYNAPDRLVVLLEGLLVREAM